MRYDIIILISISTVILSVLLIVVFHIFIFILFLFLPFFQLFGKKHGKRKTKQRF